ncbi:MAG: hypothetical protein Q8M20_02180 [Rhodocyclaceae bacterium]|nr:hypothetical protein [Rhodocyclaceae bacterium]MDZ4213189.1 hypothetical protein [Rhodocyclaceae bacterium]
MAKRDATCPLCGAKLTPAQVLDASEEIADAALGVLTCCCPHCQGHFDAQPQAGNIAIGYLRDGRFDTVLNLPCEGLVALTDGVTLRIRAGERNWKFSS